MSSPACTPRGGPRVFPHPCAPHPRPPRPQAAPPCGSTPRCSCRSGCPTNSWDACRVGGGGAGQVRGLSLKAEGARLATLACVPGFESRGQLCSCLPAAGLAAGNQSPVVWAGTCQHGSVQAKLTHPGCPADRPTAAVESAGFTIAEAVSSVFGGELARLLTSRQRRIAPVCLEGLCQAGSTLPSLLCTNTLHSLLPLPFPAWIRCRL